MGKNIRQQKTSRLMLQKYRRGEQKTVAKHPKGGTKSTRIFSKRSTDFSENCKMKRYGVVVPKLRHTNTQVA